MSLPKKLARRPVASLVETLSEGVTSGKDNINFSYFYFNKILVFFHQAVRSTHGLEVPLVHNGTLLVSIEVGSYYTVW